MKDSLKNLENGADLLLFNKEVSDLYKKLGEYSCISKLEIIIRPNGSIALTFNINDGLSDLPHTIQAYSGGVTIEMEGEEIEMCVGQEAVKIAFESLLDDADQFEEEM